MPVIPAVAANINRRIAISEITRVERAGDMAQVVEHLPSSLKPRVQISVPKNKNKHKRNRARLKV
jgi:RNase P protein component